MRARACRAILSFNAPNAGDILPRDLEVLAHNPFGHLVFAVGIPHAEALLRFPRSEPVR